MLFGWDSSYNDPIETNLELFKMVNRKLKRAVGRNPKLKTQIEITQNEFDLVLRNPNMKIVEKHFHNHLESFQVLFVIVGDEIDNIYVKEIVGHTTRIYKEK